MIDLRNITEIYVYNQKTDLRMGINGLSILAQKLVSLSELEHKIIVFYGSSNKSVKILELDGDGWWLYQKRLFSGRFIFPLETDNPKFEMNKQELQYLLEGINVSHIRLHKKVKNEVSLNWFQCQGQFVDKLIKFNN